MDLHIEHRKELTALARLYDLKTERERVVLEALCAKVFHQTPILRFRLEEARRMSVSAGHEFLAALAFVGDGAGRRDLTDLLHDPKLSDEDGTYWPALILGDESPEVQQLQRELLVAGFDPGPCDGRFGKETMGAVKCLQESAWLPRTGEMGARDWRALHAAMSRTGTKS